MSYASTLIQASELHAASPRTRSAYGTLSAVTVAALIASALTATVMSRTPNPAQAHPAAVWPAASVVTLTSSESSVPQASVVFAGKDAPIEEPAPTF